MTYLEQVITDALGDRYGAAILENCGNLRVHINIHILLVFYLIVTILYLGFNPI